jgi:hypothetical protein
MSNWMFLNRLTAVLMYKPMLLWTTDGDKMHSLCLWQVKHAQHYLRFIWYARDRWNKHNTIYVSFDMPVTGETCTTLPTFHLICPWQVKHAQHYLRSIWYARDKWNMHNTIYVSFDMPVTGETCTTLPMFHFLLPESEVKMTNFLSKFGNACVHRATNA